MNKQSTGKNNHPRVRSHHKPFIMQRQEGIIFLLLILIIEALVLLTSVQVKAEEVLDPTNVWLKSTGSSPQNGLVSGRYIKKSTQQSRSSSRLQHSDLNLAKKHQPRHTAQESTSSTNLRPNIDTTASPLDSSTATNATANTSGATSLSTVNAASAPAELATSVSSTAASSSSSSSSSLERTPRQLELRVLSQIEYLNAQSNSPYRSFEMLTPGFALGTDIWLTPTCGIQVEYNSSLAGDVRDSVDGSRRVAATQQTTYAGIEFRPFNKAQKSDNDITNENIFNWGIGYLQKDFLVAKDSKLHPRLQTNGIMAHVSMQIPYSASRPLSAWVISAGVMPRADHLENSTDLQLHSGERVKTSAVQFKLGHQFQISQQTTLQFSLLENLERNAFSGDANTVDPYTGITPHGVSSTTSSTQLQIGFSWGK